MNVKGNSCDSQRGSLRQFVLWDLLLLLISTASPVTLTLHFHLQRGVLSNNLILLMLLTVLTWGDSREAAALIKTRDCRPSKSTTIKFHNLFFYNCLSGAIFGSTRAKGPTIPKAKLLKPVESLPDTKGAVISDSSYMVLILHRKWYWHTHIFRLLGISESVNRCKSNSCNKIKYFFHNLSCSHVIIQSLHKHPGLNE